MSILNAFHHLVRLFVLVTSYSVWSGTRGPTSFGRCEAFSLKSTSTPTLPTVFTANHYRQWRLERFSNKNSNRRNRGSCFSSLQENEDESNAMPLTNSSNIESARPSSSNGIIEQGESPFSKTTATITATKESQKDEVEYPLNLPSPVLLGSSIILAIVSTGSLFECVGGKANPTNLVLGLGGFPMFLFLLYAAILKGSAETKEDDEQYLNNNNSNYY